MTTPQCKNCKYWDGNRSLTNGYCFQPLNINLHGIRAHLQTEPSGGCDNYQPIVPQCEEPIAKPRCENCQHRPKDMNVANHPTCHVANIEFGWGADLTHIQCNFWRPAHSDDDWFALLGRFRYRIHGLSTPEDWKIIERFHQGDRSQSLWDQMNQAVKP